MVSIGVLVAAAGVAFFALLRRRVGDAVALLQHGRRVPRFAVLPVTTHCAGCGHRGPVDARTVGGPGRGPGRAAARLRRRALRRPGVCVGISRDHPGWRLVLYLAYADRERARRFAIALVPGVSLILLKNFLATGSPVERLYGFNPKFKHESAAQGFGKVRASAMACRSRPVVEREPRAFLREPDPADGAARGDGAGSRESPGGGDDPVRDRAWFLEVASFRNWYGGNAFGPRYLSPALPFLGFAAAHGIQRFPKTGALLAVVSVV